MATQFRVALGGKEKKKKKKKNERTHFILLWKILFKANESRRSVEKQ